MTDFGIDDEFPGNPFVFISEVGQHPDFLDQRVLLYHPDGELKFDGRYTLLHNEKGVYHEVNYRKRIVFRRLRLIFGLSRSHVPAPR